MKQLRESHGYTLKQLGALIGVSLGTCYRWESQGDHFRFPQPEHLDRIADVYRIQIADLLKPHGAAAKAAELLASETNFLNAANSHLMAGDWKLVRIKK